jgi:hypothetical protein
MLDTDPTHDWADRTEQVDIGRTMTLRNRTGVPTKAFAFGHTTFLDSRVCICCPNCALGLL